MQKVFNHRVTESTEDCSYYFPSLTSVALWCFFYNSALFTKASLIILTPKLTSLFVIPAKLVHYLIEEQNPDNMLTL